MSLWPRQHEPASEERTGTKAHRHNELHLPTLSKQVLIIAVPSHPRRPSFAAVGTSPSAHHGFIRGAIALHTPASSGQHRFPVCGPIAGPCRKCTSKNTKKVRVSTTLCGTIPSFLSLQLQREPTIHPSPARHSGKKTNPRTCCFPRWCPIQLLSSVGSR